MDRLAERLRAHLERIYDPDDAAVALKGLLEVIEGLADPDLPVRKPLSQRDVWLIAYADHVHDAGRPPIQVLAEVLDDHLDAVVNGVHLLPFYPWTSDDGFAVVDHLAVDDGIGTWEDIESLAGGRRLMVDAVVNHVSASCSWVGDWQAGRRDGWIMEREDGFGTGQVVRPRTSPLFTAFEDTGPDATGQPRYAWTTFGPDQVDLDYRSPDVLVAMTDVLLRYVNHGAGVIRLDAVGFLWKTSDTTCIHLPETHEVIKLWRTILDVCGGGTLLITETNVPHAENISYFGDGDEAQMVYQFPLAPLVLSAFTWGNAQDLTRWAASLEDPRPGTTFFNFLASHDGIGMRPAEGLLSTAQVDGLCHLAVTAGGGVSYRAKADGSQSPYELNTTYVDALMALADDGLGVSRIAAAHAILLALQGVPGLWLGSLFGVANDLSLVRETGRLRSINRSRQDLTQLTEALEDPRSLSHAVFEALSRLVGLRTAHPAFAPDSPQRVVPTPGWLFGVVRGRPGGRAAVFVSVSSRDRRIEPAAMIGGGRWVDRLGPRRGRAGDDDPMRGFDPLILPPYGVAWLEEVA